MPHNLWEEKNYKLAFLGHCGCPWFHDISDRVIWLIAANIKEITNINDFHRIATAILLAFESSFWKAWKNIIGICCEFNACCIEILVLNLTQTLKYSSSICRQRLQNLELPYSNRYSNASCSTLFQKSPGPYCKPSKIEQSVEFF